MNRITVLRTTISLYFNGHFPGRPGLASTRMSPFWNKDDGGDDWSYKTCKKFQSNRHLQQTDAQLFYRQDAFPVAQPTLKENRLEMENLRNLNLAPLRCLKLF